MPEIQQKVYTMIINELGVSSEQMRAEASFKDDFGADSLAVTEIIMALEREFLMEIPDSDAERIQTVGDAVNYVCRHVK